MGNSKDLVCVLFQGEGHSDNSTSYYQLTLKSLRRDHIHNSTSFIINIITLV